MHHVPVLPYDDIFRTRGIPGLLSSSAYQMAWVQYQTTLVDKLNELTSGTEFYDAQPKTLALRFARDPLSASIFNHASMAYNNHQFFSGLSSAPKKLETQAGLQASLINTFGTIDTLRTTFVDTAAGMFGPGFVWLVWARDLNAISRPGGSASRGGWRILTTYNAGTPFPEAGYRQQGVDMNTQNAGSADAYYNSHPVNTVGTFGSFSQAGRAQAKLPPGGTSVLPLLCVNTWQHVWLRDYGVPGKRSFLADWWEAIDWYHVHVNAPPEAKSGVSFSRA